MDERKITKEPYMGQIQANRISGGNINLYGSNIQHHEVISITINASQTYRDYNQDYFTPLETKVEVWLSPAQWAELLTRMNVGGGTPCTIRYDETGHHLIKDVPPPPPIEFNDYGPQVIKETQQKINEVLEKLQALADKGKANKTELNALAFNLRNTCGNLKGNFNHIIKCIQERGDKIAITVKQEIAAIIESHGLRYVGKEIEQNKLKELE